MTVYQMLETAATLSNDEKFEVVEALLQMLRASSLPSHRSQQDISIRQQPPTNIREHYLMRGRQKMAALAAELSNRPNPPRDKMLPSGLFKGITITEDDLRTAEWHPTDEELMGE